MSKENERIAELIEKELRRSSKAITADHCISCSTIATRPLIDLRKLPLLLTLLTYVL